MKFLFFCKKLCVVRAIVGNFTLFGHFSKSTRDIGGNQCRCQGQGRLCPRHGGMWNIRSFWISCGLGGPRIEFVRVETVDKPLLGQAEGGGEEFVVRGAFPVIDQGRMRHCPSFSRTPASSPGCASQRSASPGCGGCP